LHLIVDSKYELPVHFRLTKASLSEVKQAHGMIDDLAKSHPLIVERCDEFTADRGYDDGKLIKKLWDEHGIKPVIDIRNLWKDTDSTRLLGAHKNVAMITEGPFTATAPKRAFKEKWLSEDLKRIGKRLSIVAPRRNMELVVQAAKAVRYLGVSG